MTLTIINIEMNREYPDIRPHRLEEPRHPMLSLPDSAGLTLLYLKE